MTRETTLVNAVGAHGTPFVVVAFEPYLSEIVELMVVGHVCRNQMAMIVDDGLAHGIVVVEASCRFSLEEEIVVDEVAHCIWFFLVCIAIPKADAFGET